jgi:hypothetical protein
MEKCMKPLFRYDNPEQAVLGHTGFLIVGHDDTAVRFTLRQHAGGPAGESFTIPLDEARALAEAILQPAEEIA